MPPLFFFCTLANRPPAQQPAAHATPVHPPHVPTRPRGSQRAAPHTHPGDVDAVAEEGEDRDAGKEEAQGPDGVEVLLRVLPGIGSGWGAEGCPMVRSVSSRRHGEKSNVPQRLP